MSQINVYKRVVRAHNNNYITTAVQAHNNCTTTHTYYNNLQIRIILIVFIIYTMKRSLKRFFKAQIDATRIIIPDGKLIKKRYRRRH